ncbi:bark storage protein A-like [Prosopis cineraria]|uniref:bark storage protein A-like n=1 Tax=Prosopis cineraria TaxID=364024 RepID=UPI00240F395B|nr:bark storage protein A-like [Prosopis cineraria]XP_054791180.1 bark storage protein A-like [Prosopis cineraria]
MAAAPGTLVRQCLAVVFFFVILVSSTCHSPAAPLKRSRKSTTIKEINRKGPYIGLITVYAPEEKAFFATKAFKSDPKQPFVDLAGRRFRVGKVHDSKVIYVKCGIGLVNAAAATQQMLDVFDISGIVHFGIAGNANSSMSIGDVIIPKQFIQTGLWDWLKPNATVDSSDFGEVDVGEYNVKGKGKGMNLLGKIEYFAEQFYSETGKPNEPQSLLWFPTSPRWLQLAASHLQGMKLERCVNSSLCLPNEPKLVVGLNGSTADAFVDNAAYRDFLFQTFHVSSLDMESSAIVMTSLSNDYPVIVIRGLSDLAGAQEGENQIKVFGSLAATNTAKAVIQFLNVYQRNYISHYL